MQEKIAIVGAGPMGLFLVKHLICSTNSLDIVVFERAGTAGTGMPYREDMSPDYMLSNIFSTEIPPIILPLADWLRQQPAEMLARWGLSCDVISERAFYPRTLLGAYLSAQLYDLVAAGNSAGHRLEVRTGQDVTDVHPGADQARVVVRSTESLHEGAFDIVVLATGHTWEDHPKEGDAQLVSPWPAANIAALPAAQIGILGSALSAVDVAVALAHDHGQFSETAGGLTWAPHPGSEALHITMVSKTGILPEADFHYPYPYDPLVHVTDDAVLRLIADGNGDVLERTFDLLMTEVQSCDPAYLAELGIGKPTIEAFGQAYFQRRQRMGAFRALRVNLAESRATAARQQTIAWRYALLRGHESFETALPHLTDDEWNRFRTHLLPVFADCYAAVPHLSLERLAALHAAGTIDIVCSGEDAQFLYGPDGGVIVRVDQDEYAFAAMIDARGQSSALPGELPFPSLVQALADPSRPVDVPFRLVLDAHCEAPVYCLSMPQVLARHPFSQGLPNCDSLAELVATSILSRSLAVVPPEAPARFADAVPQF